jgi:hypothetical protein
MFLAVHPLAPAGYPAGWVLHLAGYPTHPAHHRLARRLLREAWSLDADPAAWRSAGWRPGEGQKDVQRGRASESSADFVCVYACIRQKERRTAFFVQYVILRPGIGIFCFTAFFCCLGFYRYPSSTFQSCPPAGYPAGWVRPPRWEPIQHVPILRAGWVSRRLGTPTPPAGSPTHPAHPHLARRLGIPPAGYPPRLGTLPIQHVPILPASRVDPPHPAHPYLARRLGIPPAGYPTRLGTLPIQHIPILPAGWVSHRLGTPPAGKVSMYVCMYVCMYVVPKVSSLVFLFGVPVNPSTTNW